jgi:hydrogenase/urease accessory protein HupE
MESTGVPATRVQPRQAHLASASIVILLSGAAIGFLLAAGNAGHEPAVVALLALAALLSGAQGLRTD